MFFFSNRIFKCHARLIKLLANDDNIEIKGVHSHSGDARKKEKDKAIDKLKTLAKTSNETARALITDVCSTVDVIAAGILPRTSLMSRIVHRARAGDTISLNPTNLMELQIPESHTITAKGEKFLLYDSGPDNTRILLFATQKNIDILSQCEDIYMDGTFGIAPKLFEQLYTIHGIFFI